MSDILGQVVAELFVDTVNFVSQNLSQVNPRLLATCEGLTQEGDLPHTPTMSDSFSGTWLMLRII